MLSKWLPRRSVDQDWPGSSEGAASAGVEQPAAVVSRALSERLYPAKPSASLAHHFRAASDVMADTNGPRPTKTQRLGGAAAAAAAVRLLHIGGGDPSGRAAPVPPASPPPTFGGHGHVASTSPPARCASPGTGGWSTAPTAEACIPGLHRPLRRVVCRGSADKVAVEQPAVLGLVHTSAKAVPGSAGKGSSCKDWGPVPEEDVPERRISLDRGSDNSDGSDMSDFVPFTCMEAVKG